MRTPVELPDLVGLIYEAAAIPERWPSLLATVSQTVDGVGGLLRTASSPQSFRWTSSPNLHDDFVEFIRDGWAAINPRPARIAAANHAGFIRDSDHFTAEELNSDPVYGFLRGKGLGYAAGTILSVPSGDAITFSFEKSHREGPVTMKAIGLLDSLRPHLARAALLASRLGMEHARAMTTALKDVGLPAAAVKAGGKLYAANELFEALMPNMMNDMPSRLVFSDPTVDLLFIAGLDAINRCIIGTKRVCSFPIAATEGRVPMIVHLLPVAGNAQDIFSAASKLIIITAVDRGTVPHAEVIRGLFDLTPAEARVARQIALGDTVEQVAREAGLSHITIRNQLKSVLNKTGIGRQSDLVALLSGSTLPKSGA
ncbi:helix-turn-helix transcriptional regulator [Bradyrhizobium sp. WYCCWR 13023]|uniref:Helix-turn-helix transcriptional regulator n=1 Tax=Bradyrhizobium zhengyangense TaxID=2911009 RepID=A0A9X1UF79_9BRAD|nr:helix-turn-helix transcriptional regulator [Bradyrhizobium zhengyangense]MCG2633209.1 helix-turn-helix transcriptional regulator [Bradyrhizobium zhengyangense]